MLLVSFRSLSPLLLFRDLRLLLWLPHPRSSRPNLTLWLDGDRARFGVQVRFLLARRFSRGLRPRLSLASQARRSSTGFKPVAFSSSAKPGRGRSRCLLRASPLLPQLSVVRVLVPRVPRLSSALCFPPPGVSSGDCSPRPATRRPRLAAPPRSTTSRG